MIPLRDNSASRRLTAVNTMLIVTNLAVFAYEVSLGEHANAILGGFGLIPSRFAPDITSVWTM